MPEFRVCAKSEVGKTVQSFGATHLVTLLDPEDQVRRPSIIEPTNHLRLAFFDEEDLSAYRPPTPWHASAILDFGSRLPPDARVVVHCYAGMCRSTAAGLALWVQAHGGDCLEDGRAWLLGHRYRACPNRLLARYFDEQLKLAGRFLELCDDIGEDRVIRRRKDLE